MWIRDASGSWTFSRRTAMHALRLDGLGTLRPHQIKGVLRIERGGVCLTAYPIASSTNQRD